MSKLTFVTTVLALTAANGMSASGPTAMDRFNFDYAVQGDSRAKPLQVFDDGQRTYLQYRASDDIPAFISTRTAQLLIPRQEGPYTVLNGTPGDFVAQLGASSARITHSSALSSAPQYQQRGTPQGATPVEKLTLASLSPTAGASSFAQTYTKRNDWTDNTYAQPARGDQVTWASAETEQTKSILFERGSAKLDKESEKRLKQLAATLAGSLRIVISSADDTHPADVGGTERARVVRNALVAAGATPSAISVKVGFLFDDQLQNSGKKLLNPTTITWSEAAPARVQTPSSTTRLGQGDSDLAVVEALRAGRITPSEAVQRLKGAAPSRHSGAPAPAQSLPAVSAWSIRKADQNIENMLGRWAKDAGWKVVWKGAPTVEITADAERPLSHPDFLQAADYVVTQAKSVGYHIKATAYSNQVLVITGD
ncbi:TcpQ domain-containing protein [Polaromonas sp. JS666]|uniref:TcpQ domain-containing protein n=1 Tax=Polaromonas sp. (strain JS666 / ATCC BAA-500) TaxID=296591 RepID=UPI000053510B|nr:TcpQ domain-containing protein [Polaromonas sp. JS666]ABE47308.1 hypothetical protein Bpro_5454 [Polaromonas sp. JS666]